MLRSHSEISITMTTNTITYSSNDLKKIGNLARTKSNYSAFSLETSTRLWIIALGIRSQPRKYRWSRGGKKLFHRIHTIVSNNHDTQTRITNWNAFKNENIIEIQCKTVQPLPTNKEQHNIHCGLVNCRSIVNKTQAIQDKIGNCKLDICALMETWIKPEDNITHIAISPPGYKAISIPRTNKTGGRMAIIHHNDFTINHHKTYDFTSMECSSFTIKQSADSELINMFVVYRPPDTSVINFLDLATVLEDNINHTGEIILLGNYNIKVNDDQCMDSITHSDFLDSFGLHNNITFPTHQLQNTLDLVITYQDRNLIRNCKQDTLFSDHYLVTFDITTSLPKDNRTTISFRKIKDMDFTNFRYHILRGFANADLKSLSVNETVNLYNNTLQEAIDKFATIKVKSVNPRKKVKPWFSTNIHHEIQHCRKLERKWKLNKSDQQAYMEFYRQRRKVHNLMDTAERIFYRNKLQDSRNDFKAIYCICNGLLGCTRDLPLPPCESKQELADRFANFFSSKIKKIHSILDETNKSLVEEGLQVPSEKLMIWKKHF